MPQKASPPSSRSGPRSGPGADLTAGLLVGIAILAGLVGILAAGYVVSRRRAADVVPGSPDRVTEEVVSGLMGELRKTQAEAAHWKAAAERLQREVDRRE